MSNCKTKPNCSNLHRLLLAAEAGHKADILTYCAGHLGPHSLTPNLGPHNQTPKLGPHSRTPKDPNNVRTTAQPFWRSSEGRRAAPIRSPQTLLLLQRRKAHLNAKKMLSGGKNTPQTESPGLEGDQAESPGLDGDQTESPRPEGDSMQHSGRSSHPHLLNSSQELWEQKTTPARRAAEMLQRKLDKDLQKRSGASGGRLAAYSDVFDAVCDGSRIFGGILREIKVDYDLYLNDTMASQSSLQDKGFQIQDISSRKKWLKKTPLEDWDRGAAALERLQRAEEEVCSLEDEARRALKENHRVRTEFQNVHVPPIRTPEDPGLHQGTVLPGLLQDHGSGVCYTDMVHSKRLQVWKVWEEIQQLQHQMKEDMVPVVTTTAAQRCIQDSKVEMMRLQVSNDRFRNTNKELENNINMLLSGDNVNKAMRKEVWDKIWSVLPSESDQVD